MKPRHSRPRQGNGRRMVAVCAVWLLFSGMLGDAAQLFAWTGMFVQNAQTLSLASAIERTFSEEGKCSLCRSLDEARGDPENKADPELWGGRLLYYSLPDSQRLYPPRSATVSRAAEPEDSVAWAEPPEPPPPRART